MSRSAARWLLLLAVLHAPLLLAELFSPQDPQAQRRDLPLAPPTRLRWIDAGGELHWPPFVYPWRADDTAPSGYREDRSRPLALRFFAPAPGSRVFGWVPLPLRYLDTEPPGEFFLLGTDALGRDQWSRLLHGGRLSSLTALMAALLSLAVGGLAGLGAGYAARGVGRAVTWSAQLSLALPWLYLLLALRAALPLDLPAGTAWVAVSALLGLAGWGRPALLVRSTLAGIRQQDFVLAAAGLGLAPARILLHHVLPSLYGLLATQAALLVPRYLVAEATLSFLGVGIAEPQPSWGNLLTPLTRLGGLGEHPWLVAPAGALVLLVLGYQGLADRFAEAARLDRGSDHSSVLLYNELRK